MDFKKGDDVLVKMPGLKVPVAATIISNKRSGDTYKVKLTTGEEKQLKESKITINSEPVKLVKSDTKSKSPSRLGRSVTKETISVTSVEKNLTKSRSPSRRSPSRKSPARKSPSPSRRSPSRKAKASNLSASPKKKALNEAGITKLVTIPVEKLSFSMKSSEVVSPITQIRSRKPIESIIETSYKSTSTNISNSYSTGSGYMLENLKLKEPERIIYTDRSSLEREDEKVSDDEIDVKKQLYSKDKSKNIKPNLDFGGNIGVFLFMVPSVLMIYYMHMWCNNKSCDYKKLPNLNDFKKLSLFFNQEVFIVHGLFMVLVGVLMKIPIGGCRVANQPSRYRMMDYYLNGKFITFGVFLTIFALEWNGIHVLKFVLDHYYQFLTSVVIYSFVLCVILYVHASYVPISILNLHTISTSFVYKFIMGREVNPRFWNFDLKLFTTYVGLIGLIVVEVAYIYKSLMLGTQGAPLSFVNLHIDPVLLTAAISYMFYPMYYMHCDRDLLLGFDFQYEGLGFLYSYGVLCYPFIHSLTVKYIYEHGVHMEHWQLAIICLIMAAGLILNINSNYQKNLFRKNPFHQKVAHLETIPTAQGKKLLVSGYWGMVRHPNYLGDIIFHVGQSMFTIMTPASIPMFVSVLVLIHRVSRDGKRCRQRYGPAWDRYCQKVPYAIIPKVY